MHLACSVSCLCTSSRRLFWNLCAASKSLLAWIFLLMLRCFLFFFSSYCHLAHLFFLEKKVRLYYHGGADKTPNMKFYNIMKHYFFFYCQFDVVVVRFKRHSSSSPSSGSRFSQSKLTPFKVQKIFLSLHRWGIQEMVFPKRKSAYSFLRSTRCILKVLGDVFEWAIMRLRSSPNAPSATSCTLIGPMLPLIRKDL